MPSVAPVLSHDGSLPGFLCACAESLNAPGPVAVVGPSTPAGLFEERWAVERDDGRAAALWERFSRAIGAAAMRTLLEAFLSDRPGADTAVARALRRLRAEGASALDDLSDPAMLEVLKASARSRREAHLLLGLARFSELADGSWYAAIEPACDVIVLMADHFGARYATMRFAVHDARRGTALIHEPGEGCELVSGLSLPPEGLPLAEAELAIRGLWRTYFASIGIAERANPALQRGHMPKRYWSRLVEEPGAPPA